MRLNFSGERVLAVVAHPDDECLCAGTLARAAADGAAVAVCVLCRGEKGQPPDRVEDLAQVRRTELERSVALLGAELVVADFPDATLADSLDQRLAVVELFRRWQPTLVLTHSPQDYHPDHRAAGALAEAASWLCTSPGLQTASPPAAAQPAVWWMDTLEMHEFQPEVYVDVSDYVELKRRMLACHVSQRKRGKTAAFADLEELVLHQCRTRGRQAGVAAAEAFRVHRAWKRVRAW